MQVDPNDPNSVLWLQQSLLRVISWPIRLDPTGQYDPPTRKAVWNFQTQSGLPETGEADAETIARIEQELAILDSQSFKKKRRIAGPIGPPPKPGDPVR